MLRFTLLTIIALFFISCSQDRIVLKTIGQKPPKEMNIKIISRVTIPVLEEGYKNFSTTLITSQKKMNRFLSKVKEQKGWSQKKNFLHSLKSQKINFNNQNLLIYRTDKKSASDVLLVGLPKGDKQNITIKIGVDKSDKNSSKISHYALAYKVLKSIAKIKFKHGVEEDIIKNSASEANSKIPESCVKWFDGCNSCSRINSDGVPSCTELSCTTYKAFKCTQWREHSKQQKLDNVLSHRDIELASLPLSPQLEDE